MPKIRWDKLPPPLRDHLFERLRQRRISAEDLYALKLWRETEPERALLCHRRSRLMHKWGKPGKNESRARTGGSAGLPRQQPR